MTPATKARTVPPFQATPFSGLLARRRGTSR